MLQLRFNSSCELNRRTRSTVQAHMNWNYWSAHFTWTGTAHQFLSSELNLLTSSFELNCRWDYVAKTFSSMEWSFWNLPRSSMNWSTGSVQMKGTVHQFQFRWSELFNSSRSHERKLSEQFRFFELNRNCHISIWQWRFRRCIKGKNVFWCRRFFYCFFRHFDSFASFLTSTEPLT